MGDIPHKPLPKLRTFQLDQAHARGEEPANVSPVETAKEVRAPRAVPKIIVNTTKQEPSVATQAKIPQTSHTPPVPPAFHELKKDAHKKIEHIVAETTPKPTKTISVRAKAPTQPPRSFSSEATVITSAKKSDFKLFPAILASLKEWLAGSSRHPDTPKYTVSAVDHRKGVIQKATTNSGAVFTRNSDSLKQEITKKREAGEPTTPTPLHLSWSPQTEVGFSLLESRDRVPLMPQKPAVTVAFKKRSTVPPPQIIEPATKEPVLIEHITTPHGEPASARWESEYAATPDSSYPPKQTAPIQTPQPFTPPVPVENPVFIRQAPSPTPVTQPPAPVTPQLEVASLPSFTKRGSTIPNKPNPKTSYLKSGLNRLFTFDTTLTTVVLGGSIISFVLVFLIMRTLLGMITPSIENRTPVLSLAEPLTQQGIVIDLAISSPSYEALMSAYTSKDRPASGVTEFRILNADGRIIGGDLWSLLNFSSNPNLSRAISEARLGYSQGETILILKVSDSLTVFGALLSWEPKMTQELQPLFGEALPVATTFVDETIYSSDVRILTDSSGRVLLYGFINRDTVVITTSREAYEATLETK
jgi:hypothetical protein